MRRRVVRREGVVGRTNSINFGLQDPLQDAPGGVSPKSGLFDAFVVKLNPQGTEVIYATYLGGDFSDGATAIAVDDSGNAYITGFTASSDFHTLNPVQGPGRGGGSFDDESAFLTKLNPSGNGLVYSTYLGGIARDRGHGVAMDISGNVYVTGFTESPDFPTTSALQDSLGGYRDAFVSKFGPTGSALVYSTYLGGSDGADEAVGIALDAGGNAYITGFTSSSDFPTTASAFQPASAGYVDAFVVKYNAEGSALVYATYLGGKDLDIASGISVDALGTAYVVGTTYSEDFPTANPLQPDMGGLEFQSNASHDAFVTSLSATGDTLLYSTYLGGESGDRGCAIALDNMGNVYVAGSGVAGFDDFPVTQAFQAPGRFGIFDGLFVFKINSVGSALTDAIFLGRGDSCGNGIAVDVQGNAFVTGQRAVLEHSLLPQEPIKLSLVATETHSLRRSLPKTRCLAYSPCLQKLHFLVERDLP